MGKRKQLEEQEMIRFFKALTDLARTALDRQIEMMELRARALSSHTTNCDN